MKLVIVESPAKAKTIEKYLKDIDASGDFVVRASVGHVRDLPKSNKKAIDIEAGFVPHYEVVAGKQDVIHDLKSLSKKASEVILATDPDREGEAIAWHIQDELGLKKPERIVFHEITKEAIQEALAHPRYIDENLRQAQEARRVLDRLVGYDLSGLIWKKVRYGLSAGRVQSPALRILMEREREIRKFIPQTFYVVVADTETKKKQGLQLTANRDLGEKPDADKLITLVKKEGLTVTGVTETEAKRSTRAPFTTSTLQQTASSRLGFSPANTMRIAQKLYEAGHITYMRTDSTTLGKPAQASILKHVEKKYGAQYAAPHVFTTKSKNAQEAHEAIRPTHIEKESLGSTPEQKRLYELIWARTVASQMADAKILRTKITAKTKTEIIAYEKAHVESHTGDDETQDMDDNSDFVTFELLFGEPKQKLPGADRVKAQGSDGKVSAQAHEFFFTANGSRVLFDGWLKADPAARGEDIELPEVKEGEALHVNDVRADEKQTTPPQRYTEAGLIKELEKRGIGRPSTYASIMRTLDDRGYVTKVGRSLVPTDTGDVVSTFLEENFPSYISDTFTAEMEDELDDIATGKREYVKTLKDFYTPFLKEVKIKDKEAGKLTDLGPAPKEFPCPVCGAPMVFKLSRQGKFMSCSRFPDCIGARTETGEVISNEPQKPIGNHPETGEPIYVLSGRFGPFVQLGEMPTGKGSSKKAKPKRASIPKEKDPSTVTVEEAAHYLALPRMLGKHPETGMDVVANVGRFGPYIAHLTKPKADFRSLKKDSPYDITFEHALEILKEEKKRRGFTARKK
jgi:DNA topoisomerase-1